MKYHVSALFAVIAISSGSAFLSSAALAEDAKIDEKIEAPATDAGELRRNLEQRAQKDAAAMATDAMIAATDLDLENRPVGPISVLMASEL